MFNKLPPVPPNTACGLCFTFMPPFDTERERLGTKWYHQHCLVKHYVKVRDANILHNEGLHTRIPGIVRWIRSKFGRLYEPTQRPLRLVSTPHSSGRTHNYR